MNHTFSSYKRCFLVSDTHFGVRNNSIEWLEIQKEYFRNFFIPLLKKEGKPGDFVLHCGDVFDSRNSLNLLVMNEVMSIFEEISKIMPIVIILGNHDIYRKLTNDVNSVKILKWIPNIHIFEEPEVLSVADQTMLLMPWRNSVEEEKLCVQSHSATYLFCHTDVKGLKFNKHTTVEHGLSLEDMKQYKKIYSGHIHYSQNSVNFRMLGCPYQMTRSDMGNEKAVWLLDIATGQETPFYNTYSPKFIKVLFERILEMELEEANEMFKGNFIDVITDTKWSLMFPFSSFTEDLNSHRRLDFVPRFSDETDDEYDIEGSTDKVDILELAEKLIQGTSHQDALKTKLLATVKSLYEKVQKQEDDEEESER